MNTITCKFRNRNTGFSYVKTFVANTMNDAAVLAANYVSTHPEVICLDCHMHADV